MTHAHIGHRTDSDTEKTRLQGRPLKDNDNKAERNVRKPIDVSIDDLYSIHTLQGPSRLA